MSLLRRHPRQATTILICISCGLAAALLYWGSERLRGGQSERAPIHSPGVDWERVQIPDRKLMWRLRPNLDREPFVWKCMAGEFPMSVTTDERRLRTGPNRAPGTGPRILVLGDSTAFGLGVNDAEAWPAQLDQRLDDHGRDVEVLNSGVPGYSAAQGLRFLELEGLALKPDVVLIVFGHNDPETWNDWADLDIFSDGLLDGLQLRAARLLGYRRTEDRRGRPRLTPGEFLDTMVTIASRCRDAGATPVFIAWPFESDVVSWQRERDGLTPWTQPDAAPPSYYPLTRTAALYTNSPILDLLEQMGDRIREYYLDSIHFNAAGCAEVAKLAARQVEAILNASPSKQPQAETTFGTDP